MANIKSKTFPPTPESCGNFINHFNNPVSAQRGTLPKPLLLINIRAYKRNHRQQKFPQLFRFFLWQNANNNRFWFELVPVKIMGSDAMRSKEYYTLKDLSFDFKEYEGTFSFCLWVYFMNSTSFPSVILHQVNFSLLFFTISFAFYKGFNILIIAVYVALNLYATICTHCFS